MAMTRVCTHKRPVVYTRRASVWKRRRFKPCFSLTRTARSGRLVAGLFEGSRAETRLLVTDKPPRSPTSNDRRTTAVVYSGDRSHRSRKTSPDFSTSVTKSEPNQGRTQVTSRHSPLKVQERAPDCHKVPARPRRAAASCPHFTTNARSVRAGRQRPVGAPNAPSAPPAPHRFPQRP